MNHTDISSAARLLRHALTPKERPTPASQYRELLDRYQTDVERSPRSSTGSPTDSASTFTRPSQLGLLISGRVDSPFGVTLDNCGLPVRKSGDHGCRTGDASAWCCSRSSPTPTPTAKRLIDPANRPLRLPTSNASWSNGSSDWSVLDADLGEPEGQLARSGQSLA